MRQLIYGLSLVLLWSAITANFSTPNLLLGLIIAFVAIAILRRSFSRPVRWGKLQAVLSLTLSFLIELLVSALRVAKIVLTPHLDGALRPAIIAFPLSLKTPGEIATLANLVTLTPGTLSIDVSDDQSVLYIHVLNFTTTEAFIADLQQGFERQVREVFA